ncbi:uncharacterized protein LOC131076229 isoform X1 [Cryptomeria japonica]|uniref:uncharacterized protein LOC131076229 isoform X1 n=1 Tax=Cryptomeria japonica TaxID=3369 RepID=UPI0027DA5642|nr:uncharacterized protein LOC131076229 isoform X1 [Cryptomeria japonica]
MLLRSHGRWAFNATVEIRGHMRGCFSSGLITESSAKRLKTTMATENPNPFRHEFEKYCEHLNQLNEKRERLVKASRDVTQNSKKVIFQVHRIGNDDKETVLKQAEKDLNGVRKQHLSRVANELQGNVNDAWKLRRAFSPGIQEYVEAATVLEFCKSGKLLTVADLNNEISKLGDSSTSQFKINILDYLLGIGDLTGELMRLAISQVAAGEVETAKRICNFVRDLYKELSLVAPIMDDNNDMNKKMEIMLQSLVKIENDGHGCLNQVIHQLYNVFLQLAMLFVLEVQRTYLKLRVNSIHTK